MKGNKLLVCVVCTIVAVAAAVTAIVIFRREIAEFFADVKDKVDIKKFRRNGEYADYDDI